MAYRGLRAWVVRWLSGWTACLMFLAWLWVFLQMPLAAEMRGRLMPVMSEITVLSSRPITLPDGRLAVLVQAEAVKLRDCSYLRLDWYLGDGVGETSIAAYFLDAPIVRSRGIAQFEGLVVGVDIPRFEATRATIRHNCALGPVDSVFFVGGDR